MAKRKTKKRLPWTGFEITRVKLGPEQAVLSCCNVPSKSFVIGGGQCDNDCGVGGGWGWSSS